MSDSQLREFADGGRTEAEASFLERCAAQVRAGCVVNLGLGQGAEAIALAQGASRSPAGVVYCIGPHGGGSADRRRFYETIAGAGLSEIIAVVSLPSGQAAQVWREPVGLLFLNGDRSEEETEAEIAAWAPHLAPGGAIVFDNALGRATGASRAIAGLIDGGGWRKDGEAGSLQSLRRVDRASSEAARIHQNAIDDVMRRASELGYNPWHAVRRLGYGSFVSFARKYVYVETPKAACTTLKHLITELENVPVDLSTLRRPTETRRDMQIHERALIALPTLLEVEEPILRAAFDGHPEWFVFAVVRNPYSRIVSLFENKVRLGEIGYRRLEARYGDRGAFGDAREAFRAYVAEVVDSPRTAETDGHLWTQEEIVMPRLLAYTRVFRLERLDELYAALSEHLKAFGGGDLLQERRNASLPHADWRSYYDDLSAASVARVYRDDFEAFGYDPESWRTGDGAAAEAADREDWRRWRAEIVERNAVIDELYEKLKRCAGNLDRGS